MGARFARRFWNSTTLPCAASSCSVRSSSQAPAVSSRSMPAKSRVTCLSRGIWTARSRRSSSAAVVTNHWPAAARTNDPDTSDSTSVAATDAMRFRGSECAYPPPNEAFPTTRKAVMSQRSLSENGRFVEDDPMDLKQHIRSVPDFPKPGILFYDISTLLAHPAAWQTTVQRLAGVLRPHEPDLLVGIESRGFLVAAPLAYALGRGFAMVRKRGNLPGRTAR